MWKNYFLCRWQQYWDNQQIYHCFATCSSLSCCMTLLTGTPYAFPGVCPATTCELQVAQFHWTQATLWCCHGASKKTASRYDFKAICLFTFKMEQLHPGVIISLSNFSPKKKKKNFHVMLQKELSIPFWKVDSFVSVGNSSKSRVITGLSIVCTTAIIPDNCFAFIFPFVAL